MWMIDTIKNSITSFLFPLYCYNCYKEGKVLCNTCLSHCKRSIDTPYPWITSYFSFKDLTIKKYIHAIKYFHRKDLVEPFADILAQELFQQRIENAVLIPIPMPQLRKYIRGHNHTETLAKRISAITNIPLCTNTLQRSSLSKKRQVATRSRQERLKNQRNMFILTLPVTGKHIILIDDVTTTGATLHEARSLLLSAGASTVHAYTIAH